MRTVGQPIQSSQAAQMPDAGAPYVLEVDHLSVRFGEIAVLSDLNFQVTRGDSLAILGPNGAGKTVLFRALIGAIPSTGRVRWAPGVRIGYVPQKLDIERDVPITGLDFLRARAALARMAGTDLAQLLQLVGISREVADRPIGALSGGQFQRLLVGFALVGDPNVLLLDEPTAGVDEQGQEQLNELMLRLQQNRSFTVIFISHETSVVFRYATHVLCLGRGFVCTGPTHTVLTPERLEEIYGAPLGYHVHGGDHVHGR